MILLRACVVALALGGLSACATPRADTISFDRGQFGYAVGRMSYMLALACDKKKLSETDCVRLSDLDAHVSKQITTPPPAAESTVDLEAILRLLMLVGKLAI